MNVAYDISILGKGIRSAKYRTGIHRAIENTFQELLNIEGLDLKPVNSEVDEILNCEDYLSAKSATPKPIHQIHDCDHDAYRNRGHMKNELRALKAANEKRFSIVTYLHRKALKVRLRKTSNAGLRMQIAPDSLKGLDIYHSPFSPLPQEVLNANSITPFFTVYDLILIKHPEFFKGNQQPELTRHLDNLSGKEWICCISESTRNDLLEINPKLNPDKVKVTHLAAGTHFYPCNDQQRYAQIQAKYKLPSGPYFLSLSTLEPRKNIISAIRAFLELAKSGECSEASLVLVGGLGWNFESTINEIEGPNKLKERIILTGFVDDADLATIYSNALAFVYMSYYEGFGLPPLEAMQCGTPVITSDNSSLPEVVGDAGILLNADDQDGLKQAMLNFYNDNELTANYSEKSQIRAQQFSWKACAHQTANAYQEALT